MKLKLENHYVVNPNNGSKKVNTPLQSEVLAALPRNILISKEDAIMCGILQTSQRDSAIACALEDLIHEGFVKLVEGTALSRFVEKLP